MSHVISSMERDSLSLNAERIMVGGAAIEAMLGLVEESRNRYDEGRETFVSELQLEALVNGARLIARVMCEQVEPLNRFVNRAAVVREELEVQGR